MHGGDGAAGESFRPRIATLEPDSSLEGSGRRLSQSFHMTHKYAWRRHI